MNLPQFLANSEVAYLEVSCLKAYLEALLYEKLSDTYDRTSPCLTVILRERVLHLSLAYLEVHSIFGVAYLEA